MLEYCDKGSLLVSTALFLLSCLELHVSWSTKTLLICLELNVSMNGHWLALNLLSEVVLQTTAGKHLHLLQMSGPAKWCNVAWATALPLCLVV